MELRKRKNIRLNGYDYSQTGRYFITICSKNRVNLFGDIIGGDMRISEYGEIVQNELVNIPSYYKNIGVDVFVVMPNHVHMIVAIVGAPLAAPDVHTLSNTPDMWDNMGTRRGVLI